MRMAIEGSGSRLQYDDDDDDDDDDHISPFELEKPKLTCFCPLSRCCSTRSICSFASEN